MMNLPLLLMEQAESQPFKTVGNGGNLNQGRFRQKNLKAKVRH